MPDALETVINALPEPVSFNENAVMDRWKDGFAPATEADPAPAEESKAEAAATPAVVQEKTEDKTGIPDEILGIAKEAKAQDNEIDKLLSEEPKGQLKNQNYKNLQEKAKAEITREREQRATIERELAEVRGKLSEDFIPERVRKQLEDYQAKLKERDEELGKIAVERSPMFKERFTSRINGVGNQLKKTAEELGLEPDLVPRLLASSIKRRVEILGDTDLNGAGVGLITNLLQQHDQLHAEKDEFLTDWQSKAQEMERTTREQQDAEKAKLKEYEDKRFHSVLENMSKTFAPLRKVDGHEDWNKGVDEAIGMAKKFYDGQFTDDEFAEIVLAGAGAKRQGEMFSKLKGMYEEVVKERDALKAASPSAPPVGSKTTVQDDSKLSMEERAKRTFDLMVGGAANNGMR
jgi:hypothetical protein